MVQIKSPGIIFVGGVHGIGKTTFCQKLLQRLGVEHFSASDLIKRINKSEHAVNKHTNDISGNQEILIEAISTYIPHNSCCLLDGHFCLLDSSGTVINVPRSTFRLLAARAFIVLQDNPQEIAMRIRKRDGDAPAISTIADFQTQELRYSKQVAKLLNTPYLRVSPMIGLEIPIQFTQRYLNTP